MEILSAERNDASEIAKIHVVTWQHAYRGLVPDALLNNLSITEKTKRWNEILEREYPESDTLVAKLDNDLVGFCSVGPSRDTDVEAMTGELWAIYVHPDFMNKGVGTALHDKGLSNLRDLGFTTAILWVLTANEHARKWYEEKGWRAEGLTKVVDREGFQLHETRYIINL
jgi:GNAT superfamily N-acetyltransferase